MTKSLMNQCGVETTVFKAKDPQSGTAQLPTKALHAKAPLANVLQRLLARWHQRRAQRQAIRQTAWQSSPIAQQRFGLDWFSGTGFFGKTLNPLVAALSAAAGGGLAIQAHAQTITNVAPNGRTATNVQTSGSVLNVTTNTLAGTNAFNSFSRFDIGQQSTVNLVLPNGATHLINMVYDAPIRIDGVLNSIKGNQIGGNIVFADPYGMIVGSRGVLNVGSLTAIAPTRSFMDGVLDANGVINPLALTEMLNGRAARSADGSIRIDGRINALERVRLEAAQVTVNGTILASAEAAHQEAFVRAVNVNGLQQATGMVEKGGVIEIVGAAITVGGTLDVSGKTAGGTISIGRVEGADKSDTLSVTSSANLKADATESGDGGVINLWGTNGNTFAGTASAKGGANGGNGGFVEVSGEKNVIVSGVVDTSAASGKIGTFVIDPSDICIVLTAGAACSGGSTTLVSTLQDSTTNISVIASDLLGATVYVGDSGGGSTLVDLTTKSDGKTAVDRTGKTVKIQGDSVVFNANSTLKSSGAGVIINAVSLLPVGTIAMKSGSAIISGGGDVSLSTDSALTGGGSIGLAGATISSGGGQVILKAQDAKLLNPVSIGDTFSVTNSGISLTSHAVIDAGAGKGVTLQAGSGGVTINQSTISTSGSAGVIAITTQNEIFKVSSDPIDIGISATFVSRGGGVSITNGTTLSAGSADAPAPATGVDETPKISIAAGTAGITLDASTLMTSGGDISLATTGFSGAALSKLILDKPLTGNTGASISIANGSLIDSDGGGISMKADKAKSGITIGSGTGNSQILSRGGNITIEVTDGDAFLKTGAVISSRQLAKGTTASGQDAETLVGGKSGDISIKAENITIDSGASVLAHGGKDGMGANVDGGDVSIEAEKVATPFFDVLAGTFDLLDVNSNVTVSGKVKGGAVSISATANGEAAESEDPDSGFKMMVADAVDYIKDKLPGDVAAMISKAKSTITIAPTAVIEAAGEVSIKSFATQVSKIELEYEGNEDSIGGGKFAGAFTYGLIQGSSNLTVKSGATITAGDKLTMLSRNKATIENSTAVQSEDSAVGLTIAVVRADTSANALVESGATLTAGSVDFAAQHMGSYDVESIAQVKGAGKAGGAIALAFLDATATATFGADLSGVGNVSIEASNLVDKNRVRATTQVGNNAIDNFKDKFFKSKLGAKVKSGLDGMDAYSKGELGDFLSKAGEKEGDTAPAPVPVASPPPAAGSPPPPPAPPGPAPAPATEPGNSETTPLKIGSAVVLNLSNFSAAATVTAGTKIDSTGDVTVVAITENNNVHNIASSSAPSAPKGSSSEEAPDAKVAISLAVGVGIYNQNANATIGEGADITASRVGIHSETSHPLTISWADWKPVTTTGSSLETAAGVQTSLTDFLKDKKNGTLGAEEQVLSSYANATAATGDDGKLSLAGAVNWFDVTNNAKTYVAKGAKIKSTSTAADAEFKATLHQEQAVDDNGDPKFSPAPPASAPGVTGASILEDAREITFDKNITVQSKNLVETANVGGNFSVLLQGSGGGKGGAGGAFNYSAARATTITAVEDGAEITSVGGVNINALSEDKIFSVAPTSGRGATMGGNAIAGFTTIKNQTIAAASKRATIDAASVGIAANEAYQVWTVGGAINLSSSIGVGIALGINNITTDTRALVTDLADVTGLRPTGAATDSAAMGSITTENLTVNAQTVGQLGALAVAGAAAVKPPAAPVATPPAPPSPSPSPSPSPAPAPAPAADDSAPTNNAESKASGGDDIAYWIIDKVRGRAIEAITDNERIQTALTAITDPKVLSAASDAITGKKSATSTEDVKDAAAPSPASASPVVAPAPPAGSPSPAPSPSPSPSSQPKSITFAAAGSVTVNVTNIANIASLSGSTVTAHAAKAVNTSVIALNQTNMYSGSGGAALAKGGGSGKAVGVAGAVGVEIASNNTVASILNSTITKSDDTAVRAASIGQHIAVGVGLAVAAGDNKSLAGAGSVSVIVTNNTTAADVVDSTVTGVDTVGPPAVAVSGGKRNVDVTAIDSVDLGAGGIAIAGSTGSAMGLTATILVANNTTRARVAGSSLTGLDNVTVAAFDPSRLIAAGVTAAIATGASGVAVSGTGVVTAITNTTSATIGKSTVLGEANVKSTINAAGATKVVSSDSPIDEGFTIATLTQGADSTAPTDANFSADLTTVQAGAKADTRDKDNVSTPVSATHTNGSVQIAAALGVSAGSGTTAGVSLVGNGIGNQHNAVIDGATITSGSVAAKASDNSLIVGVAVGVAASSGKFSAMGSATANVNTSSTSARIGSAVGGVNLGTIIYTTGASSADVVTVDAKNASQIWTLAGNVAISGGGAAGGAALTYNQNSAVTNTSIRDATINSGSSTAGSVKLSANNAAQINSAAIAAAVSSTSAALSGSFSWNWIALGAGSYATVDHSNITAKNVKLDVGDPGSGASSTIRAIAGAIAVSGGSAAAGLGIAVNDISAKRHAVIEDSTVTASGDVSANATDTATIYSLGISAGVSSSVALGASIAANIITNDTLAQIGSERGALDAGQTGTTINATGNVGVSADTKSTIYGGVINAVASSSTAVGAAMAVNVIAGSTTAELGASAPAVGSPGQTTVSAYDTTVHAASTGTIYGAVVNIAASSSAAVGAVFAANYVGSTTAARVGSADPASNTGLNTALTATHNVTVDATNNSTISAAMLNVAVSGNAAVGGVFGLNLINNTTSADVTRSSIAGSPSDGTDSITVKSEDTSTINNIMVAVSASATAAVGGSFAVNRIGNNVSARVWGDNAQDAAVAADNLTVSATSKSKINSAAAGVAVSGTVAVAGTAVVNIVSTNVTSEIDRNADVLAQNNVAVVASNADTINNAAGSVGIGIGGAGVGLTAAVNIITGATNATIGGHDSNSKRTKVDALGLSATGATVSNGTLNGSSPVGQQSAFATGATNAFSAASLTANTQSVRGVAVNALAVRTIASGAATAGGGLFAGVAGTVAVSAIAGETNATVTNADINQRQLGASAPAADTAQDVDVRAASHTYAFGFTGSVGIGAAGFGAALDGQGFGINTKAIVSGSNVAARDDVTIQALATEGSAQLDIGAAAGAFGLAGTGSVAVFRGNTEARLKGGATTAQDVLVKADHQAGFGIVSGAAAGGLVGGAGAFNVGVNLHSVVAQIGDESATTNTTAVTTTGTASVQANSNTTISQWTAVGAVGGGAFGLAVGVGVLEDKATAKVTHTDLTTTGAVLVDAKVDSTLIQRGGAISIGLGTGISGTVGIALSRGQASATIEDSSVSASAVTVTALNRQDVDGVAMGGALGGVAGVAGSFQLTMVGYGSAGADSSSLTSSDGAFTKSSDFGKQDRLSSSSSADSNGKKKGTETGGNLSDAEITQINDSNKYDYSGAAATPAATVAGTPPPPPPPTSANTVQAQILRSTIVTTVADTAVNATSETATRALTGVGAVGFIGGAAGAVSITRVYNGVNASIDATSSVQSAGNVTINALAKDKAGDRYFLEGTKVTLKDETRSAISNSAAAGAGGGIGAIAVSYSDAAIDNVIVAKADASTLTATGLTVAATDQTNASAFAVGLAAGGVAAGGASVVRLNRTGSVTALVDVGNATTAAAVSTLNVSATEAGSLVASNYAGSAAFGGALQLTASLAKSDMAVSALLGSDDNITVSANATVTALRKPRIAASAIGVAVSGGYAMSGTWASSTLAGSTVVDLEGAINAPAGTITLLADNDAPSATGNNLDAFAVAAGGGLLLGAAGAAANTYDTTDVSATYGAARLSDGDINIKAKRNTRQNVKGTAVSVGFIGLGLVSAQNSQTGKTAALLTGTATQLDDVSTRTGAIGISADSAVGATAFSQAGSGGVLAGNSANAGNSLTGITSAGITKSTVTLKASSITVTSNQAYTFSSRVDNLNAALIGASGANVTDLVNGSSKAYLENGTKLSAGAITMKASQYATRAFLGSSSGDDATANIDSGSGGLFDAPAVTSKVTVLQATSVDTGEGSGLSLDLARGATTYSALRLDSYNSVLLQDKVKVNSYAAIPLAKGEVRLVSLDADPADATSAGARINAVNIGKNTTLTANVGDILMGARTDSVMDLRLSVGAYGIAAFPQGTGEVSATNSNQANVYSGAVISAPLGSVYVGAGYDSGGTVNNIDLSSEVRLWNHSATALGDGATNAIANLASKNTIVINEGATVSSNGDIGLETGVGIFGKNAVRATGIGKDYYREAAAAVASGISNALGGGDVSFDQRGETKTTGASTANVTVNGTIQTAVSRNADITFDIDKSTVDGANGIVTGYQTSYTRTGAFAGVAVPTFETTGYAATVMQRIQALRKLEVAYAGTADAAGYKSEREFLQEKLISLGLAVRDPADANGILFGTTSAVSTVSAYTAAVTARTTQKAKQYTAEQALVTASATYTADAANKGTLDSRATSLTALDTAITAYNAQVTIRNTALSAYNAANAAGKPAKLAILNTENATLVTKGGDVNSAVTAVNAFSVTGIDAYITSITGISGVTVSPGTGAATATISASGLNADQITKSNSYGTAVVTPALTAKTAAQTSVAGFAASVDGLERQIAGYTEYDYSKVGENPIQTFQYTYTKTDSQGNNGVLTTVTAASAPAGFSSTSFVYDPASKVLITGPVTEVITVPDLGIKLGNINVRGDNLIGTGVLSSPADARITITNNTPSTLKVNNLTIDSQGGSLRLNGALVNTIGDINALNIGANLANFSTVTTKDSGSGQQPTITISNTYNPLAAASVVSTKGGTNTSLTLKYPGADIILSDRGEIRNLNGGLTVYNAGGSIYSQGSIRAGSIDIKADNGDFVQSYVDGFFHVGGDPKRIAETSGLTTAGAAVQPKGLVANGAILVSARFLNINGLVQSGVADWTTNLPGTGVDFRIAGSANSFGLTNANATDAAAFRQTYLNAIAAGTPITTAMASKTYTGIAGLAVNFDADINEFSALWSSASTTLDAANSAGVYAVPDRVYRLAKANAADNVGASYDAANDRYLVDGIQVKGGLIKLFGQLMNTDPNGKGQLKALDGYAQININNTSQREVVLRGIDTGGNVAGKIQIDNITNVGETRAAADGGQLGVAAADITAAGVSRANYVALFNNGAPSLANAITIANTDWSQNYIGTGNIAVTFDAISNTFYAPLATVQRTIYTRNNGNINVETFAKAYAGTVGASNGSTTVAGRDTTFTLPSQVYRYADGADQSVQSFYSYTSHDFFGLSALRVGGNLDQYRVSGPLTLNSVPIDSARALLSGPISTYTAYAALPANATSQAYGTEYAGVYNLTGTAVVNTLGTMSTAFANKAQTTSQSVKTGVDVLTVTNEWSECDPWFCITKKYTKEFNITTPQKTIQRTYLDASNPIGISFIGYDSGLLNVNSSGNVRLSGTLQNLNGTTNIRAGVTGGDGTGTSTTTVAGKNIFANDINGSVSGNNVNFFASGQVGVDASGGSAAIRLYSANDRRTPSTTVVSNITIGGEAKGGAFNVQLMNANTIANNITASGTVSLLSRGNLGQVAGTTVKGQRVELTSLDGSIGVYGDPAATSPAAPAIAAAAFKVDSQDTSDASKYTVFGVELKAAGDINVIQTNNQNMLVQSANASGRVRLSSTQKIVDGNPIESVDKRTFDQLINMWDKLNLLDGSAGAKQQQMGQFSSFDARMTSDYFRYWDLKNGKVTAIYATELADLTTKVGGLRGGTYSATYRYDTAYDLGLGAGSVVDGTATAKLGKVVGTEFNNTQQYDKYWSYRNHEGGTYSGTYTLSAAERDSMRALGSSETQIDALQTQRQTEYRTLSAAGVGSYNAGAYSDTYMYKTTGTEQLTLLGLASGASAAAVTAALAADTGVMTSEARGATWTEKQLGVSVTPGLLKTTTSTNVLVKDPNITGRTIQLLADKGVGRYTDSVTVDLSKNARDFTDAEKVALSAAERSDLVDANGNLNLTGTILTIKQSRLLNVDSGVANVSATILAEGLSQANSQGDIFLGSRGGLNVDQIKTNGQARVKVTGNLWALDNSPSRLVVADQTILESADQSIGTLSIPLLVQTPNAASYLTARAQTGIYLSAPASDLKLDTVYSPGAVNIKAIAGGIQARFVDPAGAPLLDVQGDTLVLNASGNIGAVGNPLDVVVTAASAAVSANSSGGGVYLRSTGPLNVGPAFAGGGSVVIDNAGAVTVSSASSATGGFTITSGGAISVGAAITAGDTMRLIGDSLVFSANAKSTNAFLASAAPTKSITVQSGVLVGSNIADSTFVAGDIYLLGSTTAGTDLTFSAPTGVFNMGRLAFGALAAVSGSATAGRLFTATAGSINMNPGSSIVAGSVANLTSNSGDTELASVTGSSVFVATPNGGIHNVGGASVTNIAVTSTTGQVGLNQGNLSATGAPRGQGIGTASQALRINAPNLYATTSQGLVNLQLTAANTQAMNIESGNSSVKVDSLGSFSAQRISAGGMGGVLGTVGGPIDLSAAGNISVTTTQAKAPAAAPGAPAATLSASAGGGAYFNAITVPGNVNIQASSATLGSATTQGSLTVRASNYLSAGSLNASGGNISLNAASGALNVGQANALTGAIIASAGPQGGSISSATARDGFALTSLGAWTLGNLVSTSALSDITVTAGNGGIQYNQLTSARDISVASTGGALTTQLGSNATGRNITMAAASAQLGNVSATGTLSIASASGDLIAGTLSSGGADTLSAGRDLSVTSMASASGAVIASASRYFTLGGVTAQSLSITALLDASINALNTTLFASVASTNASATVRSANVGTTANFSAKTLLDIGSAAGTVTATGPMTLTGGSLLRTTGAVSSGNTLSLLANATGGQVQMLTGSTLRSVGTLSVTGSSLTLTDIAATGATSDVLLTANGAGTSGAITFGAISALRNIQLTATGAVTGSGTLSKLIKAGGKVTGSVLSISGAAIEVGAATPGVQNAANTQVSYASGGSLTATGGTLAFTNKTNISNAPAPAPVPAPPAASRR